nr:hypothetical protein [Tanacetum cinerariifolium]
MDMTGMVAMTTIAAATTTTTLAVTTGIPVMEGTIETGVISPTDLPILALSNPGVPLRVTPIQFALLVDVDTKESVVELQADKKPGSSSRVFAITKGQAANTSGVVVVITTAAATTTTTTTLTVTTGIPVMDGTRETGVLSNPGVPLRVTPIQFAVLVGEDTKESVVELQVLASSVVKLAIYRKIAGRTP